jgi:hypothetical protein
MVHLMLAALLSARSTNFRAHAANRCCVLAAARHHCGGYATSLGTVDIERDTSRHCRYMLFLQAHCCAVVTSVCASVAGVDAALKIVHIHDFSPSM